MLGDASEARRAVIDGIHRCDDRQQRLRGADVARGLLAADVLLAGLQGAAARRGGPGESFETPTMRPGMLRL